jgi:hypothetical protein
MNRAAIERDRQFNNNRQQLAAVERKVGAIVSAIEDGATAVSSAIACPRLSVKRSPWPCLWPPVPPRC